MLNNIIMPKELKNQSTIGFEFEFLREKDYTEKQIAKDIKQIFGVKVNIEDKHHSEFKPTAEHWKLEPDYSGGKLLVELVTGPLDYEASRTILSGILNYIKTNKNLSTNERCGIHINVNLKKYIEKLDVLKYILEFDEDKVYKYFPNRKGNIYTKSIKSIFPVVPTFSIDNLFLSKSNYAYPSTKYYGINFLKLMKGYLEFRYLGGENYEQKSKEIQELADYFIESLYICGETPFTKQHKVEIKSIILKKRNLFEGIKNYESFKYHFKKITLLVDGEDHEQVIKTHFHKIASHFLNIFVEMQNLDYDIKGIINYDSDLARIEFSEFKLQNTEIDYQDLVIFDSKLIGCVVNNCEIINSELKGCDCTSVNTTSCIVKDSRLTDGTHESDEIEDSYITHKNLILSGCEIKGLSIFREGMYKNCDISDDVELIDAKNLLEDDK